MHLNLNSELVHLILLIKRYICILFIEIPLFHVLNARITFGNIFAMDNPVPHVNHIEEEDRLTCILDDGIFESPPGYKQLGNGNGNILVLFFFIIILSLISFVHFKTFFF